MKKHLIGIIILCSSYITLAQKPQEVVVRGVEAISQNGVTKGYFSYIKLDRKDKKNENFKLTIFDINLKITLEKSIIKPIKSSLKRAMFNGENFFFVFSSPNPKKGSKTSVLYEIGVYDSQLNLIKTIIPNLDTEERFHSHCNYIYTTTGSISTLFTTTNDGLVSLYGEELKGLKGFRTIATYYNNKGEKEWSKNIGSKSAEKSYESFKVYYSDSEITILIISSSDKPSPRKTKNVLVTVNTKTGEILAQKQLIIDDGFLFEFRMDYDKTKKEILATAKLYGLDKKGKIIPIEKGFIFNVYDINGKLKDENLIEWKNNSVVKEAKIKDGGKLNGYMIYFHELRVLNSGKKYIIAEQLANAGVNIKIGDLMILEFNQKNELIKISSFDKPNLIKRVGFKPATTYNDYSFINTNDDHSTLNVIYTESDKDYFVTGIGVIKIDNSGEYTQSKISGEFGFFGTQRFQYFGAKLGYIAIFEYFEKTKKVDFRIEKFDL
jgi:Family of unknown function (DUF6770)